MDFRGANMQAAESADRLAAKNDEIAAKDAEIARLLAEIDDEKSSHRATFKDFSELQQVYRAGLKQWDPVYKLVIDDRDALLAEIARLRGALVSIREDATYSDRGDAILATVDDALSAEAAPDPAEAMRAELDAED